jgi:hypothetical protein
MADPTCPTLQGNYIQQERSFSNTIDAYTPCNNADPNTYPMPYIIEDVPDPYVQRNEAAIKLTNQFWSLAGSYHAAYFTGSALQSAALPMEAYNFILTSQLEILNAENQTIKDGIASGTNTINQINAMVPELSNTGPFGATNLKSGMAYGFLTAYGVFFISLCAVLYIRYKNTIPTSVLWIGILLLLGGACAGAYFCAVSKTFGLGL